LVIETASVDKVVKVCEEALKGMGLKVTKEERHKDGTTSVMAKERAFIPLTMRVLSYPFSLGEYIKSAQRAGLHVVISPCGDGVRVLSCGIALDEVSGKPATYTKEETIEEITDFMEATDFENKFINKIKAAFPNYRDVKQEE
jgi:hypothetical protein